MKKELIITIALLIIAMFMVSACSSGQAIGRVKSLGDKTGKLDRGMINDTQTTNTEKINKTRTIDNNTQEEKIFCTDSDGNNTHISGIVTTNLGVFHDKCNDITNAQDRNEKVKEYFCDGNKMNSAVIDCANNEICENGACVEGNNTNENSCTDSDGGFNYYLQGTCIDTDNNSLTDFCNGTNLIEYICGNENLCTQSHNSPFVCPYGCENGACVEGNNTNQSNGTPIEDGTDIIFSEGQSVLLLGENNTYNMTLEEINGDNECTFSVDDESEDELSNYETTELSNVMFKIVYINSSEVKAKVKLLQEVFEEDDISLTLDETYNFLMGNQEHNISMIAANDVTQEVVIRLDGTTKVMEEDETKDIHGVLVKVDNLLISNIGTNTTIADLRMWPDY